METSFSHGDDVFSTDIEIVNARGLHARASAKFVKCCEEFNAEVLVSRDGQSVSGLSIMGLMMLAAGMGSFIHLEVKGEQAKQAFSALVSLVSSGFGEEE